ncbi:s-adenosylmethionine carrier protein [Anaeramoeba flamelloides]|uniref:S-adenosylmethionine carrier protein n=1 Tax=Anaeramoeba flamelloides TaxID=1746091 RepID=A0ABQ8XID5_9EUKA|nr:s-adenosylmethionine carrier protein [Anaeramoeba flamelloides]
MIKPNTQSSGNDEKNPQPKYKLGRHFFTGSFAKIGTAVLFSPGDTIKTRIQFSGYSSKNILKSSILGSLTSAPMTGLSFLVYHYVKTSRKTRNRSTITRDTNIFSRIIRQVTDDPKPVILGGLSRACVIGFRNPLDIAKQYYQLRDVSGVEIKSMSEAFKYSYKKHGLLSFFDGFTPFLIRDFLSYPLYWGIYDFVKEKQMKMMNNSKFNFNLFQKNKQDKHQANVEKQNKNINTNTNTNTNTKMKSPTSSLWNYFTISKKKNKQPNAVMKREQQGRIELNQPKDKNNKELGALNYIISSTCATLTSATLTIPFDVLKTKMQTRRFVENGNEKYGTIFRAAKTIYTEEGLRGFVKGLGTKLSVIVPASAATFTIYESIISYLEKRDRRNDLLSSVVQSFSSEEEECVDWREQDIDNPFLWNGEW